MNNHTYISDEDTTLNFFWLIYISYIIFYVILLWHILTFYVIINIWTNFNWGKKLILILNVFLLYLFIKSISEPVEPLS